MRFAAAALAVICVSAFQARADVFSGTIELPPSIKVSEKRAELLKQLPTLVDSSSRLAISKYRQELDRFNTVHIMGFYSEINGICVSLNEAERNANKAWDRGNLSRNEKLDIDEQIKEERLRCSDKFASTSPYFKLYYELVEIYQELDSESLVLLSECNSREECRNK